MNGQNVNKYVNLINEQSSLKQDITRLKSYNPQTVQQMDAITDALMERFLMAFEAHTATMREFAQRLVRLEQEHDMMTEALSESVQESEQEEMSREQIVPQQTAE